MANYESRVFLFCALAITARCLSYLLRSKPRILGSDGPTAMQYCARLFLAREREKFLGSDKLVLLPGKREEEGRRQREVFA